MGDNRKERHSRPETVFSAIQDGALLAVKASVFSVLFGGVVYGAYRIYRYQKKPEVHVHPYKAYCTSCEKNGSCAAKRIE